MQGWGWGSERFPGSVIPQPIQFLSCTVNQFSLDPLARYPFPPLGGWICYILPLWHLWHFGNSVGCSIDTGMGNFAFLCMPRCLLFISWYAKADFAGSSSRTLGWNESPDGKELPEQGEGQLFTRVYRSAPSPCVFHLQCFWKQKEISFSRQKLGI